MIGIFLVLGLLVSSCSGSSNSEDATDDSDSNVVGTPQDPQIFSDVVAGAYTMSSNHARSVRIRNASLNVWFEACGGVAVNDLSSTANRFNQTRYADLQLISEKGLVEGFDSSAMASNADIDLSTCEQDVIPSVQEYGELRTVWDDATRTANASDSVSAVGPDVASCLASESGLEVAATDPTASYLSAVDRSLSAAADWDIEMLRFSGVYVLCTGPYFEALEAELQVEQDKLVERNRELLERFAQELSDAGYVP